jgi:hypothetical protein
MRNYPNIAVQIPDIYLPNKNINYQKWAVIACDQFTSQPQYWREVETFVGDSPSTLKMILPEAYLGKPEEAQRAADAQSAMQNYLQQGVLEPRQEVILVKRTIRGKSRHGILLALDLDQYDYAPGSQTLIRATEGTIVERIPPRMRIRENALLELPHILVLIDDPQHTVLQPLIDQSAQFESIYDFDLMQNSGHLNGYRVPDSLVENSLIPALEKLAQPANFQLRYGVGEDKGVLLFAVGDGNHSLATAKACWEKIKPTANPDHPARYALVEIENVHDAALEFEPIHRVLFKPQLDLETALKRFSDVSFTLVACESRDQMIQSVKQNNTGNQQIIGVITAQGYSLLKFTNPAANLPVGTLQAFLDRWLKDGTAGEIDYVHGEDAVCDLCSQTQNVGFYLPAMAKSDLFKTVILDGVLPRKTFSMGEAYEKRFYLESRRIR